MVNIRQAAASARHHACCRIKEFLKRQIVEAGSPTLAEGRDKITRESGTMYVHTHTHHRGSVEHCVDASF